MTTKDYVLKYRLNEGCKFNHSEFVQDLASDFIALLELNKAENNIKGFDNATRCIKMKFDAISNKTLGILPESLWKYFFATVIAKLRDQMCPKDMERRREESARKKAQWEAEQEWKRQEYEQFNSFWDFNFFAFLFSGIHNPKPTTSFTILGLNEDTATVEDVKSNYKKLVMLHHPDKGGKQDDFIKITEAKNKCLTWLNK